MQNVDHTNRRILIIDDQESIHQDFKRILSPKESSDEKITSSTNAFLGETTDSTANDLKFEVDSAYQGQEGLKCVLQAIVEGSPYAMAFVDMRMPPGWDGVETIQQLWKADSDLEIVICTAFSDYTWEETIEKLGQSDHLLILKKPFDNMEISQLAYALTEKWNLSRKAKAKLGEIQSLIDIRTRELMKSNEHLVLARDAAEASNKSKSEFLANMSHEIRTPMTAILGFSELLSEEGVDTAPEKQLDAFRTIQRNGEYLLEIINDILDLSKIDSGKLDVERIECSPCHILAGVASLMNVPASSKGLTLEIEYEGPIPQTIFSDPTRLRQILINLIGNAIKFTETGVIRIVARLLKVNSSAPEIEFDIVDQGIGMTGQQVDNLFKPFIQADTSTTRKFGGTGLGLTISKRLAKMLGGNIRVETAPREGSTFSVAVLTGSLEGVKMVDKLTVIEAPEEPEKKPASQDALLNCRILLAEDGPDNQRLISFVLNKAGAEVTIAENGQIALDLALAERDKGTPFDVILMDMQMPVLDGYAATQQLRDAGYTGPIIALTAHAMNSDRAKCIDVGCNDYASKPIDRKKLIELTHDYARASVEERKDAPIA